MNARAVVTFVGGPLHGTVRACDAVEGPVWHTLPDGQVAVYGPRCSGSEPALARRILYAPIGMADSVYVRMAALLSAG